MLLWHRFIPWSSNFCMPETNKTPYFIKQQQDFKGLTPILKEIPLKVKCYQTALHDAEKSFVKGRVNGCNNSLLSYFRSCNSHSNPQHHHPDLSAAINTEARPSTMIYMPGTGYWEFNAEKDEVLAFMELSREIQINRKL